MIKWAPESLFNSDTWCPFCIKGNCHYFGDRILEVEIE
jgi:hypothetical protein